MVARTGDYESWANNNSIVQLEEEWFLENLIIDLVMENNEEILQWIYLYVIIVIIKKFGLIK